ncbi:hypothetical protein ACWGJ2_00820 [Streptomyces sp. NPDC054796]
MTKRRLIRPEEKKALLRLTVPFSSPRPSFPPRHRCLNYASVAGLWLVTAGGQTWAGVAAAEHRSAVSESSAAESIGQALTVTAVIAAWVWLAVLLRSATGPARWWPLTVTTLCFALYLADAGGLVVGGPSPVVRDLSSGVVLVGLTLAVTARCGTSLCSAPRGAKTGSGLLTGLIAFLALLLVPVFADGAALLPGPHLTGSQTSALAPHTPAQALILFLIVGCHAER